MNNDTLLAFQRLDVYGSAKELARLVHLARIRDAELRDQATRASKSTFLGLCEGLPSDPSQPYAKLVEVGAYPSQPRANGDEIRP